MDYTSSTNNSTCLVELHGSFTFNDNQKFRDLINIATGAGVPSVILRFADVDFIDSAALGMLLLLHDECSKRQISVTLDQPRGQVRKMFDLSRFDQLFHIAS